MGRCTGHSNIKWNNVKNGHRTVSNTVDAFDHCKNYYRPHSSFGSVQEPESCRLLILSPARLIFFLRIDDNNWDRIHSPLTSAHCFINGYVGK